MKFLALLLFCAPLPAFALVSGSSGGTKYSLAASLALENVYYPAKLSPQTNQDLILADGELNGTLKVGDHLLFKARPTDHLDPANNTERERRWADLPEGYVQYKGALFENTSASVRLGMDTFTWGVTDGYNPVDVVSARRYSDPVRSEKLGAFSATGRLDFGSLLFEGIYIPWQRESTLPGENSRWLPRSVQGDIVQSGVVFHPPAHPSYYFRDPNYYDAALQNNFGARLSSHFLGMDVAGYYFNGAGTVPAVGLSLRGTTVAVDPVSGFPTEINADSTVGLRPLFHRVQMGGLSAVVPVGEIIARAEAAYTKDFRSSSNITERLTEAVLELEHTFSFEKATLTAILLGSYADPHENPGTTTSTPSLTRLFDRALGAGLRWQPIETWQWEGFVVADTKHGGQLYRLDTTYTLSDHWKIYGEGEIYAGAPNTPIGVYSLNDRYSVGLKLGI